jgi:SAM-dependent methyltransferase
MQITQQPNLYTSRWLAAFLGRIDPATVAKEMRFLESVLPRPEFHKVLDVCCGVGRHTLPLSRAGYNVVALDRSEAALRACVQSITKRDRQPDTIVGDMRTLPFGASKFDAIINMWQSFGQFDPETNRRVLAEWARVLRVGGRLVIDLYHRAYHEHASGSRRIVRNDVDINEVRAVEHGRLHVTLTYSAGNDDHDAVDADEFDWQLYSPAELAIAAEPSGLKLECVCTDFDETRSPTMESPRMQLVFVRAA